jgi:hypothetical protein
MEILEKILGKHAQMRGLFERLGARTDRSAEGKPLTAQPSRWYEEGIDIQDVNGPYACQRLRNNRFMPVLNPVFQVGKTDSFFAIGSCFARGIESALKGHGFKVESAAKDFDKFELQSGGKTTNLGFTNKYTTHSILNELIWALDPRADFPEASLVDLDAERCIDPHINPTLKVVDRASTLERRRVIKDVMGRIRHCRVVFITLGLVEAWYDTHAGVYLNITPMEEMLDRYPHRYEFATLNYLQNMENMEKLYGLLSTHGHPDLQIIITTSPVPLQATYTGQDVVIANTYSKSTLRAVSQDFASAHPNVQYFPSYEIVMNSNREAAWSEDLRHVRGDMANYIMDIFVKSFVAA